MMAATYTAVISQEGPWWVGWVEEVPGVAALGAARSLGAQSRRSAAICCATCKNTIARSCRRVAITPGGTRHNEIKELLVRKICRDLALPAP
jgi:uncharacterized membrane protein